MYGRFPFWHPQPDRRWLSDYRGKVLRLSCATCREQMAVSSDRWLEAIGDHHLPGLCVKVAVRIGCPRVYDLKERCGMSAEVLQKTPAGISPIALAMIYKLGPANGLTFGWLKDYHVLFAQCECGRMQGLNVQTYRKRFRDKTLGEIAQRMRCKACGERGKTTMLAGKMER